MEILKKTAVFRVQKQTEGKAAEEVTSISLSGVPTMPELWTPYAHLTHLMLVCMKPKLTSLQQIGLEALTVLRLLDVSDNAVTVPSAPPTLPSLARLLMPNNAVTSMEEVDRLALSFPGLEVLDLVDNDVDTPSHFVAVFGKFPRLIALNARTRDGTEVVVEDSDESESEESDEEEDDDEEEEEEEEEEGSDDEGSSGSDEPVVKKPRQEGSSADGETL